MSESLDVNRRIAELCGWTIKRRSDHWLITAPDRHLTASLNPKHDGATLDEAWAIAGAEGLTPDYLHSLDAMLAELRGKPVTLHIDFLGEIVQLTDYSQGRGSTVRGTGDTVEAKAADCLCIWAMAQQASTPDPKGAAKL